MPGSNRHNREDGNRYLGIDRHHSPMAGFSHLRDDSRVRRSGLAFLRKIVITEGPSKYFMKRRIPMSDFMDSGARVEGAGGLRIFFRSLRPKEKPRAFVVIVPGFNAHSGYYEWVAEQFVAAGVAVYAVDLRGRGSSDGERFYVENFEDYVSDVEAVVKVARSRESSLPVFLLGHSAGG